MHKRLWSPFELVIGFIILYNVTNIGRAIGFLLYQHFFGR